MINYHIIIVHKTREYTKLKSESRDILSRIVHRYSIHASEEKVVKNL